MKKLTKGQGDEIERAKRQAFIMAQRRSAYYSGEKWVRWSGPWKDSQQASDIIHGLRKLYPNKQFCIVGCDVTRIRGGSYNFAPRYTDLP